jgi:hypothetical protein
VTGSVLSTISEGRDRRKAIVRVGSCERKIERKGDKEGKKAKKGNSLGYLVIAYM